MSLPITVYLILAGVLFTLGALTVLLRRNAIIELMGVELMLNSVNLVLVTFSRIHGNLPARSSPSSSWWWPPPRSWWV